MKTDGESSIVSVQRALAAVRTGRTVPQNSSAIQTRSNGGAEKPVQDVTDMMRRLLLALEARLKTRLALMTPAVA